MTDNAVTTAGGTALIPPRVFTADDLQTWHYGLQIPVHKITKFAKLVLFLVFGLGSIWAMTVPLGGAIIARGSVVTEDRNRLVQSFDGGVIADILVREGDRVQTSQVIARLDTEPLEAQLISLQVRRAILRVQLARRQAAIAGLDTVPVPTDIPAAILAQTRVQETISGQKSEFAAMRDFVAGEIRSLTIQIDNLRRDNVGLQGILDSSLKEEAQTRELAEGFQELYDNGGTISKRVLNQELARLYALEARIKETRVQMEQNLGSIESAENQKAQVRLNLLRNSEAQSVQFQTNLNQTEREIDQIRARIERAELRAPTDGTVLVVHHKTLGGVLRPAETVMEIFPSQDRLLMEARVNPSDITDVVIGQKARVQFGKIFSGSPVTGKVVFISDDAVPDPDTSQSAQDDNKYVVRVLVDAESAQDKVFPANSGTVYLETEPRTFFEIISGPFSRLEFNAFKN